MQGNGRRRFPDGGNPTAESGQDRGGVPEDHCPSILQKQAPRLDSREGRRSDFRIFDAATELRAPSGGDAVAGNPVPNPSREYLRDGLLQLEREANPRWSAGSSRTGNSTCARVARDLEDSPSLAPVGSPWFALLPSGEIPELAHANLMDAIDAGSLPVFTDVEQVSEERLVFPFRIPWHEFALALPQPPTADTAGTASMLRNIASMPVPERERRKARMRKYAPYVSWTHPESRMFEMFVTELHLRVNLNYTAEGTAGILPEDVSRVGDHRWRWGRTATPTPKRTV